MKISQFAKTAGVNVETVRYYHRKGVLDTPLTDHTYRQYSEEHLKQMAFIQSAKSAGLTLAEIKAFRDLDAVRDRAKIRTLSEQKKAELERKIDEIQKAMGFLDTLITQCRESDAASCPIIDGLRGVDDTP